MVSSLNALNVLDVLRWCFFRPSFGRFGEVLPRWATAFAATSPWRSGWTSHAHAWLGRLSWGRGGVGKLSKRFKLVFGGCAIVSIIVLMVVYMVFVFVVVVVVVGLSSSSLLL